MTVTIDPKELALINKLYVLRKVLRQQTGATATVEVQEQRLEP